MTTRKRRTRSRRPPSFLERHHIRWEWHWRSIAAVVYLVICMTDFVGMPLYRELTYNKMSVAQMVITAKTMAPDAQVETLRILKEDRKWTPLTNDMLHIAFGAILGVAALPQNRRRRYNQYSDGGYSENESEDDGDHYDSGYVPEPNHGPASKEKDTRDSSEGQEPKE